MEILIDEATKMELEEIREYCLRNKYKIAVAESVTSGMIQLMMSCCPNAGLFFSGGITAYSCFQKHQQLGISYTRCQDVNGVSQNIAESMAQQICRKFKSEIGLSITGFASPIPEKGINELYAFATFQLKGKIIFTKKLSHQTGNQLKVQQNYASDLIRLIAESIKTRQ